MRLGRRAREALVVALLMAVVAAILGAAAALGLARYEECRRVHPAWYCLTGGGR